MSSKVIIFTLNNCSHCTVLKNSLTKEKIDFDEIEIEERDGKEIYELWYEKPMAPKGVKTYNPAFDVTDAKYITAVITEKGIVYPPYGENLKKLFEVENDK